MQQLDHESLKQQMALATKQLKAHEKDLRFQVLQVALATMEKIGKEFATEEKNPEDVVIRAANLYMGWIEKPESKIVS